MLDTGKKKAIREAFQSGQLEVESVTRDGKVSRCAVSDVMRHSTSHKRMVRVTLDDGRQGEFTEDHSVFTLDKGELIPVETKGLLVGVALVVVHDGVILTVPVATVEDTVPEPYTFDLSVPGPENFRLSNGILAHNSYSIGGISLDLEKSSKYQSMMDSASAQLDKATEAKARTVKFIKGLQQPRFGQGIRSAFGPATGRGVLSPRGFV